MCREYVDFEIRIAGPASDGYPMSFHEPGGDAAGSLVLPIDAPDYRRAVEQIAALDTDEYGGQAARFQVCFAP